jgi:hypothetical protein
VKGQRIRRGGDHCNADACRDADQAVHARMRRHFRALLLPISKHQATVPTWKDDGFELPIRLHSQASEMSEPFRRFCTRKLLRQMPKKRTVKLVFGSQEMAAQSRSTFLDKHRARSAIRPLGESVTVTPKPGAYRRSNSNSGLLLQNSSRAVRSGWCRRS